MKQRVRLALALAIEFTLLVVVMSLGDLRDHVPAFLVLFVAASISYLLAVHSVRKLRCPLWALLAIAVVLRVPLFFTQPSLSDDVWRYIHDGRAQLAGVNPYKYAPHHPATESYRGPEFERINHRELPTIYPPVAQLAFRIIAALPSPLLAWRLLLLAAELAMLLAAARLLRSRGYPPINLALYAWHPLAIIETIGSAHVEMLGITLLVLALLLVLRGAHLQAGVALAASVAAKLVAAPLVIIITRHSRLSAAFVLTLAALYLPFLTGGSRALGSLGVFVARWDSNSSLHALFAPLVGQQMYRLCAALLLVVVVVMMRVRNVDVIDAAAIYFLALFALAPVVHPWYLLWVLAILPLRRAPLDALGIAAMFWTISVALGYGALYEQQMRGEWRVPTPLLWLQYLPFYLLVVRHSLPAFSMTNLIPSTKKTAAKM